MSLLNCPEQTLDRRFFSIWQNWNRRVLDRLFFPIGKIGVDDFLDRGFSIGKNGIDDFWVDDFQFGKWKKEFLSRDQENCAETEETNSEIN